MSTMTRQEFEAQYAAKSGVTLQWLWDEGQISLPCDCGEEGCQGWQMRAWASLDEWDLQFVPEPYKSEIKQLQRENQISTSRR